MVISNLGGDARVYCSFSPHNSAWTASLHLISAARARQLSNLSPGTHKLAFKQGNDEHAVDFDPGPVPTLTVFLATDQDVGSLMVITGVDKAQILLDGQPYKRTTQGGQLRITELAPKDYLVRVVNGISTSSGATCANRKRPASTVGVHSCAGDRLAVLGQ